MNTGCCSALLTASRREISRRTRGHFSPPPMRASLPPCASQQELLPKTATTLPTALTAHIERRTRLLTASQDSTALTDTHRRGRHPTQGRDGAQSCYGARVGIRDWFAQAD